MKLGGLDSETSSLHLGDRDEDNGSVVCNTLKSGHLKIQDTFFRTLLLGHKLILSIIYTYSMTEKTAVIEGVNRKKKKKKKKSWMTNMLISVKTAKMAENCSVVIFVPSHTICHVSFPQWNGSRTENGDVLDVR